MTNTEIRLRKLAREKRLAECRDWHRRALCVMLVFGKMPPYRPNLRAWWWGVGLGD